MDAARGVKGHGGPLYAGPRSIDGMREVERSETRMEGQAFLLTFFAFEKSESPCKAKPVGRAEESAALSIWAGANTRHKQGGKRFAVFHPTQASEDEAEANIAITT
ncbi:hypothetical protein EGJ42_02760 [Stutzerimonas stutzeri]|nr:hypothetical protein EGJ42_02760 [Stutzerimonas stutzeri]